MSSIFSDGALHPGRDADDARWIAVRRPQEWIGAAATNVLLGPPLTLVPGPLGGADSGAQVEGLDGTVWRIDGDWVVKRGPCDAAWVRFVGGRGTATGELRGPLGLALDARRGLLAICDTGNHRVQLVRADSGEPVLVLGPFAEPVAAAFGRRAFAVADRAGGQVHVYDDRFEPLRAFAPVPPGAPAPFAPRPTAVALDGCVAWVIDAAWSAPVAYGFDGAAILDPGAPPAELAPWLARGTWVPSGELIAGPFDGQTDDLAWHRAIVDADVPAGTAVEVQTFASDDPAAPAVIPWAPARPAPGPLDRPVLSDQGRWLRARGTYLRVRAPIARLVGTGPINAAGLPLAWPAAQRLRAGDLVELRTAGGASTGALPIAAISTRVVTATARGTLAAFGAGATLTLLSRGGAEPAGGPRAIGVLAAGDSLDASAAHDDGTLYDLPATHAVAALLRDGDVAVIASGAASATLVVSAVQRTDAIVALAAPAAGDFSTSALLLLQTQDRLVVDALDWPDDPPPGEPIDVRDDDAGTQTLAPLRWAERDTGTLWLGAAVPYATWTRFTVPDGAATDRGRYLWLRLRLVGAVAHLGDALATASPRVHAVRLSFARPSLLRMLPAVYSRRDADDPSGASFLERFLALPQQRLATVEAEYEGVAREVNPRASSPDWLRFLAAWFGLAFDPSWPIERRRELVIHANELFAKRGTVEGIRRYFEIYTGSAPAILEGFQWGGTAAAHRFAIWVDGSAGPCDAVLVERAARAILDSIKPAHTAYELYVVSGAPRIGIASTIGVDMVLVGGGTAPPVAPNRLGPIPLDDDFTLT